MKNIIMAAGVALALAACSNGGDGVAKMDGLEMDSVVASGSCALTSDANSPRCDIALSVQYAKGRNADKVNQALMHSGILAPDYMSLMAEKLSVKQVVDTFIAKYKADYKEFYAKMYLGDKSHPELYGCKYRLSTKSQSANDSTLTYIATIVSYGGGLHETRQTLVKNINVDNGKVMTLDDLFIHGYEKALKGIIVEKLCERFDVDNAEALAEKTIFADGDIYVSDNFIVGKKALTFIYCEDEIASHEVGEIRVDVDYDDMGKLLRDH